MEGSRQRDRRFLSGTLAGFDCWNCLSGPFILCHYVPYILAYILAGIVLIEIDGIRKMLEETAFVSSCNDRPKHIGAQGRLAPFPICRGSA